MSLSELVHSAQELSALAVMDIVYGITSGMEGSLFLFYFCFIVLRKKTKTKNKDSITLLNRFKNFSTSFSLKLVAIHSLGIAHRDLKPKKILLAKRKPSPNPGSRCLGELSELPFQVIISDFSTCYVDNPGDITAEKYFQTFAASYKFSLSLSLSLFLVFQCWVNGFKDVFRISFPRYAAPEAFARFSQGSLSNIDDHQFSDVYQYSMTVWEILHREVPWKESPLDVSSFPFKTQK